MTFAATSFLIGGTQVEVTGQEHIAGIRVDKLEGIKLEGVGLATDVWSHGGEGLVFPKATDRYKLICYVG